MIYIKSVRLTDEQAANLKALGFILELDCKGNEKKADLFSVFVVA